MEALVTHWLITGGCGFIGAALANKLAADPANRIRILDNLSVGTPDALHLAAPPRIADGTSWAPTGQDDVQVDIVVGDIRDDVLTKQVAERMDVIVHLAANTGVQQSIADPCTDCTTNVIGVLNMLEAARGAGAGRFIMASSGAPLGSAVPPFNERTPARPISPYGASKLAGEAYCSAYAGSYGVAAVPLRFSNVYGPGSGHKGSVVTAFLKRALKHEPLRVNGDGHQTRDFLFLNDLLEAILSAAMVPGIGGETFQIGTGRETSVLELVQVLAKELEAAGFGPIAIEYRPPLPGDVRRNYADVAKAREMLGWSAKTFLPDGLKQTVKWFAASQY